MGLICACKYNNHITLYFFLRQFFDLRSFIPSLCSKKLYKTMAVIWMFNVYIAICMGFLFSTWYVPESRFIYVFLWKILYFPLLFHFINLCLFITFCMLGSPLLHPLEANVLKCWLTLCICSRVSVARSLAS